MKGLKGAGCFCGVNAVPSSHVGTVRASCFETVKSKKNPARRVVYSPAGITPLMKEIY